MKGKKFKYIAIIDSSYTLFLYLLYYRGAFSKTLFIMSDGIPKSTRDRIRNKIYFRSYNRQRFSLFKRLFNCVKLKYTPELKSIINNRKCYEVIGQDHLFYSFIFTRGQYTVLEDGIGNYRKPPKSIFERIKSLLAGGKTWGYSDNATKVQLTKLSEIPDELKRKTEVFDIQNLWRSLSSREKSLILNVFPIPDKVIYTASLTVLLTQPFSEDGVLTEHEKISLYGNIIINYPEGLVIKPHPRELTDYTTHFNCNVLDHTFPFQLLMLINPPEKIVTCFSSVGFVANDVDIDMYGTSLSHKLSKRYGVIASNVKKD